MKEINITIDPQGAVKLETKGFKGIACRIATGEIERALGQVTSDKPTAEASLSNELRVSNQS